VMAVCSSMAGGAQTVEHREVEESSFLSTKRDAVDVAKGRRAGESPNLFVLAETGHGPATAVSRRVSQRHRQLDTAVRGPVSPSAPALHSCNRYARCGILRVWSL